jgi:hypothetical protein
MSFWKRLHNRLFAPPAAPPVTDAPATHTTPAPVPGAGYPRTYQPAPLGARDHRPQVFDPALKHYARALRPGDPTFENDDTALRWAGSRRLVTDHVLRAIAESERGERLILRGSRLLQAWVGEPAREPGDLDWIVDSPTAGPDDPWCAGLCAALVDAVFARPAPPGVELIRTGVATDDIWTYERAPGRRVVFPWRVAGLPGGAVQVDVVFRETLAESDRRVPIPAADGGCISVRAAGPAQSLAWKLAWLATDSYPQGKDLYDAVLIAERFPLSRAVLERTFRLAETGPLPGTTSEFLSSWNVDWDNFVAEYPWIGGTADDWLARLAKALGPTFTTGTSTRDESAQQAPPPNGINPTWLTSDVLALGRGIDDQRAYDRLPILADALQDAGCDNADVLDHCRGPGPHVRGCWVVDLVLGWE